jgi:RNase P subunit RPR2
MPSQEELYQKVKEWMDRLPRQLRCPACDDHHWELHSLEETLGLQAGTTSAPLSVVPIHCQCCGHISFFSAKAMGLSS